MTHIVKISVRTLVEYVFRGGNIESGFRTSTSLTDGTKAHQKIQSTYKEDDQKEVLLKTEIPYEDFIFKVEGRCDGLLFTKDEETLITIDEIKSTSQSLERITEETHPVHWAQAIFYAYIYATDHALAEMNIQLTYVQVKTEEQKKFQKQMTYQELESYVKHVVEQYVPYAMMRIEQGKIRDKTAKELSFPFDDYRNGQRKLAGAVYKTIIDKKNLFAKASTGIGKTISTLFPAIKAIGEGELKRIFYLTAKTITRTMAEETMSILHAHGLDVNVVTITAKDKVCFNNDITNKKEHACGYGEGHYDRVNGAVLDIIANESLMTRQVIDTYAVKHRVCPFEFSLDLAYVADVVICDYNYIFDPMVSLQRLFEEQRKETVLLIDEAHNLVDRARGMFSAELVKSSYLNVMREYKGKNSQLVKAAKAVNDHFLVKKKQLNSIEKEVDDELVKRIEAFIVLAEIELISTAEPDQTLLDIYFSSHAFVKISSLYDERFVTYLEVNKSEVMVKLFCLDPSNLIEQMGKGYQAKVFFSATLTPADYYKNLLGGTPEDYVIAIGSPFDRENAEIIIQPLSTRYRDRERTMSMMVETFVDTYQRSSGNVLIFFPSYKYMLDAYELFIKTAPHIPTIVQDRGMSELEREEFLAVFKEGLQEPIVGFAVLGGIFSEGIDLRGERLTGVIVVGVGLPQIGLERDIIKDYFNKTGRNGFDYSYVYPGMNKVLQAGGRLIRSELDQGIIVLIDDRFLQQKYQALLPYEWQHFKVE